jgi:ketosteroid isomerase-like protein
LRNAYGQHEVDEGFTFLEKSFSDCTSYTFELQAYDVEGDMAYTAGLERASNSFDGQPRSFTLRATQVYRRLGPNLGLAAGATPCCAMKHESGSRRWQPRSIWTYHG